MTAVDPGLLDRVRERLADAPAGGSSPAQVAAALRGAGGVLGDTALLDVVAAVSSELSGLGPLQALLADGAVTDVLVHGNRVVWLDRGHGLEDSGFSFRDDDAVRRLAQRLAAGAGRRLDEAAPFADLRLPGGVRMHAVLAPISAHGTCISLRVGRRRAFSLEELVAAGSVPGRAAQLLRTLVASRLSTLVSGGTGTGKTTVLATLLGLVPANERIVVIEDSGELAPDHPHVVHLEARPANIEGAGAVTVEQLVRQALRMRPDRLVVGEVRGREVVDLLAALNTGHDGGFGTVHAGSAADVPARLEALGLAAGLDRAALHSQLAAGVQAVVHLVRHADGRRRIAELGMPVRASGGLVSVVPAATFTAEGEILPGPAADRFASILGPLR